MMNYYEHHIGDYQRKTAHLSLAEHGAYTLMLQTFYATERPLPADRKVLYRLLRADTSAERKAVDAVVTQFWEGSDDGLTNKRAAEVLDQYKRWVSQQKANGKRGGRPKETQGLTDGITQTEPDGGDHARVPLPTSHLDQDQDTHTPPKPPQGGRVRGTRKVTEEPEWTAPTEEELRAGLR